MKRAARWLVALAIVGWGAAVPLAADLPALLRPYLEARAMAAPGSLDGSAYQEPTSPTGPSQPYASVPLLLVPHSAELEAKLESIQSRHRDSARTYTGAHKDIVETIQGYRAAVVEAGGGDLIKEAVSDAKGRFRFVVPAGRWLLLGWRETAHPRQVKRVGKREAGQFVDNLERTGYAVLTYWKVQVEVEGGRPTEVHLHDRNVWITAIREELRTPPATPMSPLPPSKRDKPKGVTP